MIDLDQVREWHVLMFAVQVALGLFTAMTGFIDVSYGQFLYGGFGLGATPIFFWFAYRHHKKLRMIR